MGTLMSRRGHYLGGGTTIDARDTSWFNRKKVLTPPDVSAPKPALSPAEQRAFDEFKHQRQGGAKLIKAEDLERPRRRKRRR
jgi:hypothetical protein